MQRYAIQILVRLVSACAIICFCRTLIMTVTLNLGRSSLVSAHQELLTEILPPFMTDWLFAFSQTILRPF